MDEPRRAGRPQDHQDPHAARRVALLQRGPLPALRPRSARCVPPDGRQHANLSAVAMTPVRERLSLPETFAFPTDGNGFFPVWMTAPVHAWVEDGFPIGSVFATARAFWPYRRLENLHLLHYRDLRCDLEAEMRRPVDFLGIRVSRDCWPALARAAGFRCHASTGGRSRPRRPPRRLDQQPRLLQVRPPRRMARRADRGKPCALRGAGLPTGPARRCAPGWKAGRKATDLEAGSDDQARLSADSAGR